MSNALVFGALAVAVALLGRVGWRQADSWAAQAWEDPIEQDRRRLSLRRGALACWVAAVLLAVGGVASAVTT